MLSNSTVGLDDVTYVVPVDVKMPLAAHQTKRRNAGPT